ncbi:agmatine deiminase family protein [Aspergillus melleus]|uniref:agmatine deiminase family protein n=1 Tax=Aspergillus melleus TaxID=138277 RepID=UPI001E8D9045|nr:uncharacterized protein LDX57_002282 [Aspergillus melleus]KAH8424531.1 hypothetical protein LDX57_002282 [Aspergillus melleus]
MQCLEDRETIQNNSKPTCPPLIKHSTHPTQLPGSKSTLHTSSLHHQQQQQTAQFYLPHESVPHAAAILGFPSRQSVSRAFHPGTCREIVDLAVTIAEFEPVRLYTRPEDIVSAQGLIKQRIHRHPASTSQSLCLDHDSQDNQENGNSTPVPDLQSRIQIIPCPTNHCWVRDTGPVFVRPVDTDPDLNPTTSTTTQQQQQEHHFAVDFSFCEWGNKHLDPIFTPLPEDTDDPNTVWPIPSPTTLAENTDFAARVIASFSPSSSSSIPITTARVTTPLRLEGGGIEVDGQGTFFATESSIFCPQRNPDLTRATAEEELTRLLGVRKFIWFPGRKGLDITDAHVDALVRVVRPGVVVVSRPRGYGHESLGDGNEETTSTSTATAATSTSGELSRVRTRREWKRNYTEILAILSRETDALGRRFEVHEIEEPDPKYLTTQQQDTSAAPDAVPIAEEEEEDPAASYVNFYLANGAVVMPVFGDPDADERAVRTMRRLLPEREVRTVRVNCLPRMGGVVHCVTQQVPAL